MGLFDKTKTPEFVKEDSDAEKQLAVLREMRLKSSGEVLDRIDQEISKVEAGIAGEKQVHFELANSHMSMCVLHDLFLEDEGLTAQIDYMVITMKNVYIIECKNLFGNIEIDNKGNFVRSYQYKGRTHKEGIYSPITQNQRHMELIKKIRKDGKGNIITKMMFEKGFDENYHSIVVLANPKTVLNDKYAKKEIKEKVIRADQLISYIKSHDAKKENNLYSEKEMKACADFFISKCVPNPVDYTAKFRGQLEEQTEITTNKADENSSSDTVICPVCGAPMVLRTAKRGDNAGNQFYGCSNYPKCKGIKSL